MPSIGIRKLILGQHKSPNIVGVMGSESIKRVNFNHIKIKEPNYMRQRDFTPTLSRNESNHFNKISQVKVLKVESPHVDCNDILPHNSPLGH